MKDNIGILLPVASLPGKYGIGDFSRNAIKFLDWLKENGYAYWQVLPLNPLGPGNSPYMSTCSEALDERYIDLDDLKRMGLIKRIPKNHPKTNKVDYVDVLNFKNKYLWKAFCKFRKQNHPSFARFKKENNKWLTAYIMFTCFREDNYYNMWINWENWQRHYFNERQDVLEKYRERGEYIAFKQYLAYKHYNKIYNHAKKIGIKIIADCPFYVGIDSTDCWLHKEQFVMDNDYHPTLVSGCPPDAFSDDGQLWGTPIYDFEKMRQDEYSFLCDRLGYLSKTCDLLRLDHFRAFDTYCVIPAGDENARRGEWKIGPRYEFFDSLYHRYPNIKLIAEDLGDLFQGVHDLRDHYNLPGMNVVEFTIFDPKAYPTNKQIVYPGTHDNETLWGWLKNMDEKNLKYLSDKFNGETNLDELYKKIFRYIYEAPSYMTIFQLQDILKLDNRARINWPGTVNDINWSWKLRNFKWMKHLPELL